MKYSCLKYDFWSSLNVFHLKSSFFYILINVCLLSGLYQYLMFEDVQEIYFGGPEIKMSQFVVWKRKFVRSNLRTVKFLGNFSHGFLYTNLEFSKPMFHHVKKGPLRVKTWKWVPKWHFSQKYFIFLMYFLWK